MWIERRLLSFDATPLFYRTLSPSQPPKAVLLMVHGMGEHSGRYKHVAEFFVEMGIKAVAFDLRGFGQSGGRRGSVNRASEYLKDFDALEALIRSEDKDTPLFVLGHSFGGLLAAQWIVQSKPKSVKGLILSSPLFEIALKVPLWRRALAAVGSLVAPHSTQPSAVKAQMLSHDKDILAAYGRDRLIHHHISARLFTELTKLIKSRKYVASNLLKPVLIVQAGQDVVVSKEATQNFFTDLQSGDKELEIYPELYHEILNESDRHKVMTRIGLWINAHL